VKTRLRIGGQLVINGHAAALVTNELVFSAQ